LKGITTKLENPEIAGKTRKSWFSQKIIIHAVNFDPELMMWSE
jgi:hypothetical protein